MRKVLVTGGSSFIGSSLIKYYNRNYPGFNITNFDRHDGMAQRDMPTSEFDSPYNWIRGDLLDRERVWHHTTLSELIINCVWSETGAVPMASNEYVEITMVGLNNLLQSARVRNTSRFVQMSTADVYGPRTKGESKETDVLKPANLAAGIRGAADVLVHAFREQWDLGTLIIRPTNVYGPYMSPHELLPTTIKAITSGRIPPEQLDKGIVRDWIHIDDLCSAVDVIIRQGAPGDIYNVASGELISDATMVTAIGEAAGKKAAGNWSEVARHSGVMVSNARLRKLGWEPKHKFSDEIAGLIPLYSK